MRRVAVGAGLLALLAASPATGATRVVAALGGNVAAMSAWNGRAVFSQLDAGSKRWRLMRATAGGVVRLGVAPQNAPFDADVGTDGRGRPVAVFSRCPRRGPFVSSSRVAGTSRCRLWVIRLDVTGASPRPIRALAAPRYSDGAPTIWRGRVAFGRVVNRGTMAAIFIQRRPGSRRLLRLGRGTIPACPQSDRRCFRTAAPMAMDLGPSRLAFTWALDGGNVFAQVGEELWSVPLDGAPGRLLDVGGAGECGLGAANSYSFRFLGAPTVLGRVASYLALRGDCWVTDTTFTASGPRWDVRRERRSRSPSAPRTIAHAAARDRTGWWWVRGPRSEPRDDGRLTDPCGEGRCALVHSDRLALRRVEVERRPRPPVGPPPGR